MKTEISIITPLYNGIKTLPETFESIRSQDFTAWEWIMYDDGSTDNTQELARKYSGQYKEKIFYFEHKDNKNFGTSYTRNRAVEKSNSGIIAFIDQDDVWYPGRLSHQFNILEKNKDCAVIWGPSLYWYKEREFKQPVGYRGKGLESGMYNPPQFVKIFLSNLWGAPLPSASLVKKECFDEVKGYEESIRGSEDIVLWLKLAEKFPIYYDDEIIVKYRKHTDSTLRVAQQSGIMDEWNLGFYLWVIEFLKKTNQDKSLIEDMEFKFYSCLKKMSADKNYFESRKKLYSKLCQYPEIKEKYKKDFLLDILMPFKLSSRISAKLRFDLFK